MDRYQLITGLLMNVDLCNEAFVNGNMDEDTWTKELQGIDQKLSVLGLRLDSRPWETGTPGKRSTF